MWGPIKKHSTVFSFCNLILAKWASLQHHFSIWIFGASLTAADVDHFHQTVRHPVLKHLYIHLYRYHVFPTSVCIELCIKHEHISCCFTQLSLCSLCDVTLLTHDPVTWWMLSLKASMENPHMGLPELKPFVGPAGNRSSSSLLIFCVSGAEERVGSCALLGRNSSSEQEEKVRT